MSGPLGYLFWHRPGTVDRTGYEESLRSFHEALSAHPPAGFVTSWTWRLAAPPWFDGADPTYLDVYLTANLSTLAELERGAVTDGPQPAHDRAAAAMAAGAGALLQVVAGDPTEGRDRALAFVNKPPGTGRDPFVTALVGVAGLAGGAVWMRRLVLGPGPEYLVTGADHLPAATVWSTTPSALITG
ncbi:MAG: hypothetical protein M3Y36_04405 [Actinomycetota bacterium]|nr:hypothetical protein [Actinomycetota bacterium]